MNDIVIIDKIQKQLETPRPEADNIFPLSPTHRKELRELRSRNVGNLRNRLSTIKTLKEDEYKRKYAKEILEELQSIKLGANKLNQDWTERITKINQILSERKKIEEKANLKDFNISSDYDDISKLTQGRWKREVYVDEDKQLRKQVEKEFNEKYGKAFTEIDDMIEKITTQYEEAINFGDLELVKQLYYMMKNSDKLFEKISDLKI